MRTLLFLATLFCLGVGAGQTLDRANADCIHVDQVFRRLELLDIDAISGGAGLSAERDRWDGPVRLYAIGVLEAADGTELELEMQ
jgi:hypothetical protein